MRALSMELRNELKGFSKKEGLFFVFAALVGFLIACEYGITRPASQALFLTAFSSKFLPLAWLAAVPLNFAVIVLYNRYLPQIGPMKMIAAISSACMGIHLFCAFFLPAFPQAIFFQFVWKDVYVLLMFKQLWSMVHSTIAPSRAKYLYGLLFAVGTTGSIFGSALPSFFASQWGSERLYLATLPLYLLLLFAYHRAFRLTSLQTAFPKGVSLSAQEGFTLIRQNRLLGAVLLLVVLMQISIALMEYQFNAALELSIFDKDLRTEYCGKVSAIINIASVLFQCIGSFFMVHTLGVRGSHLFIPSILLASALFAFAFPGFLMASAVYAFFKSVDYSLFGVVREMLYLPLQIDAKYRAKAIIDVFAYRSSKALVSLLIFGLQIYFGSAVLSILKYGSITIFVVWILAVALFLKKAMPSELTGNAQSGM